MNIPLGTTVLAQEMAKVYFLSASADKLDCYTEFLEDTVLRVLESNERVRDGLAPVYGFSAFNFIRNSDVCAKVPTNYVPVNEVNRTVEAVLAFFLLHEMAHHALGHLNSRGSARSSRVAEAAADVWAIKKMLEIRVYPITAVPALLPLVALQVDPETHPPFADRVVVMHEAMLDWLIDNENSWASDDDIEEARELVGIWEGVATELKHAVRSAR